MSAGKIGAVPLQDAAELDASGEVIARMHRSAGSFDVLFYVLTSGAVRLYVTCGKDEALCIEGTADLLPMQADLVREVASCGELLQLANQLARSRASA